MSRAVRSQQPELCFLSQEGGEAAQLSPNCFYAWRGGEWGLDWIALTSISILLSGTMRSL